MNTKRKRKINLFRLFPYQNKYRLLMRSSDVISSRKFDDFCSVLNSVLSHVIKCFAASKLDLNLDKRNNMKFITENSSHPTLRVGYKEKYIERAVNTKFLVLPVDNVQNGKNHIEQIISKFKWSIFVPLGTVILYQGIYFVFYVFFREIL